MTQRISARVQYMLDPVRGFRRNYLGQHKTLAALLQATLNPVGNPATDVQCVDWRNRYNIFREQHDPRMDPAYWHLPLSLQAQWRAEDMLARGYFDHRTPEGWMPWDLARMMGVTPPGFVAECIGFGYREADPLLEAYKASPTHLQVLEDDRFTHHGCGTAWGPWQGGGEVRIFCNLWIGGIA